jgi:hypothetical protein
VQDHIKHVHCLASAPNSLLETLYIWPVPNVILCSAEDQAAPGRDGSTLEVPALGGPLVANSSLIATGRQSLAALASKGAAAFSSIPRGSIGPGSVAGGSIAGTVVTTLNAGRPGSGAKSQISGVSAKSRASAAATASLGAMLAKDKLTQVRTADAGPSYVKF